MTYPNFKQLQTICKRYDNTFSRIDSSMLTRQGKLTRDMWRCTNKAFSEATDLEDALTRLSLIMDELMEKLNYTMYDSSYIRDSVKNIRSWVVVHVDHAIWSEYPMIANPWAA